MKRSSPDLAEFRRPHRRSFAALHAMPRQLGAYALAASRRHVIPGHDPLVLKRYPAPSRALEGIVARLDVDPVRD